MKRFFYLAAPILGGVLTATSIIAAPIVFNDEAAFRAAAGASTTYGFETHGVVEGDELAFSSPLTASQLDNNFDLAYNNFNGFQIIDNATAPGVADGTHYLFTHSQYSPPSLVDYSLTFSNFSNSNKSVTAFGLTITDFASNLGPNDTVSITYTAGSLTGTLFSVTGGQPDFTQNFVGVIVDGIDAFNSITLTMNDNLSGFQDFDEIIYSLDSTDVPTPATLALMGLGFFGLSRQRNRYSG